jgi:hypothetical protein
MQAGGGSPHTGASDEQRGSLRGRSYVETAEEAPYFLHHCPDHSSPLSRWSSDSDLHVHSSPTT